MPDSHNAHDAYDQQWCACAQGFLPACLRDSWVRVLLLVRLLLFWLGVLWALLTRHGTMVERGPPKIFHHCIPSGKNPWAHTHIPLLTCIMHHVHCDCLAPQYWEYYPNIRLHYIGHPCHSSDFQRTPKLKLSSKQNQNLVAIWGVSWWLGLWMNWSPS